MLKTPMHQINNITHAAAQILFYLVTYIISPITFFLAPVIKIFHPNLDVTLFRIFLMILSTIIHQEIGKSCIQTTKQHQKSSG